MTALSMHHVLVRYQLPQQPALNDSFQTEGTMGINGQFISTLMEAFEQTENFSEIQFQSYSLPVIIDYIKRTHQYYIAKKLPEIEQSIHLLLQDYDGHHPLLPILLHFYRSYSTELKSHIETEEKKLIPYIENLVHVHQSSKAISVPMLNHLVSYSLDQFLEEHDDMEQDLSQIREVIRAYHPPKTNESPYRILLSQLEVLEKDLHVHALIEEKVLLPKAASLEKACRERMRYSFS